MTRHVHEITALYRAYEPHSVMIAAEAVQARLFAVGINVQSMGQRHGTCGTDI